MKKIDNRKKAIRYRAARERYCSKRRSKKWIAKKYHTKAIVVNKYKKQREQKNKPYISHIAPKNFSLIDNPNEVLAYFETARRLLKEGNNLTLDISDVDTLTAPTIALMVASVNSQDFLSNAHVQGSAPKKPELKKLFTESGFYDHVNTQGRFKRGNDNYLHKEVSRVVDSKVAKEATQIGTRHVFGNDDPFDPIYDTLVECMQNTNNHAHLHKKGECYWWLFLHSDPLKKTSSYSFLDLGVGIFNSIKVKDYKTKFIKASPFHGNISIVDDLLSGKIGSRMDIDREIRGKGIPQIYKDSKSKYFGSFCIIVNNVIINLKTGDREKLKHQLNGTFLYWELENNPQ